MLTDSLSRAMEEDKLETGAKNLITLPKDHYGITFSVSIGRGVILYSNSVFSSK